MTEREPRDTAATPDDPGPTSEREERDQREEDASDELPAPAPEDRESDAAPGDAEEAPVRFVEVEDDLTVSSESDEVFIRTYDGEAGSLERQADEVADEAAADEAADEAAADEAADRSAADATDEQPRLVSSHDVDAVDAARGPQTSFDPDSFDADSLVDHGLTLGGSVPQGIRDQLAAGMSDAEVRTWMHDYANGFGIDTTGMDDQQLLGAVEQATFAELGGYDHVDVMPSRSAQQAADDYELLGGTVTEDPQGNLTFHQVTFGSEKGEALSTIPAGTDVDAQQATANAALGLPHDALPAKVAKEIARDLINDPSHHLGDIESVEVHEDTIIITFTDGSTKTYEQGDAPHTQDAATPSDDHHTSSSSSSDGSGSDDDDDDDDDDDGAAGDDEEPEAEDEVPDAADSAAGDEGEAGEEGMPSPAEHYVDPEKAVEALLTNPAFAAERDVMIRGLEQQVGGGLLDVDLGSEQALHDFLLSPMGTETLQLMRMAVENQGLGGQTTPAPDDVAISVPDEYSLDNVALQAAGGGAAPPPDGFGDGAPGSNEDAPLAGPGPDIAGPGPDIAGPGPDIGGPGTTEAAFTTSFEEQVVAVGADDSQEALGLDDEDGIDPTIGSGLGALEDVVE